MLICQLTNCTHVQMMGYVIKTKNGRVIVIDGGGYEQSEPLEKKILEWGGVVDMWFITHNHSDHFGSIMDILKKKSDIKIKGFWRNNCSENVLKYMSGVEYKEAVEWIEFEKEINVPLHEMSVGETFDVDGVKIEVLGVDNPDITVNNSNNQSVVLKFTENAFSMIFLADLGIEGGEKLLKTAADKVQSTAVQMAHHGQAGVAFDVYDKINAKYAFWPTPKWLWDNTKYLGGEPGTGKFKTPETIEHMNKLGVKHITSFDSDTIFDTEKEEIIK